MLHVAADIPFPTRRALGGKLTPPTKQSSLRLSDNVMLKSDPEYNLEFPITPKSYLSVVQMAVDQENFVEVCPQLILNYPTHR